MEEYHVQLREGALQPVKDFKHGNRGKKGMQAMKEGGESNLEVAKAQEG